MAATFPFGQPCNVNLLFSSAAEALEKLVKVIRLHVFVRVKWVFGIRMEGKVIGPGPYRATKLVSLLVTLERQKSFMLANFGRYSLAQCVTAAKLDDVDHLYSYIM